MLTLWLGFYSDMDLQLFDLLLKVVCLSNYTHSIQLSSDEVHLECSNNNKQKWNAFELNAQSSRKGMNIYAM